MKFDCNENELDRATLLNHSKIAVVLNLQCRFSINQCDLHSDDGESGTVIAGTLGEFSDLLYSSETENASMLLLLNFQFSILDFPATALRE